MKKSELKKIIREEITKIKLISEQKKVNATTLVKMFKNKEK
jgi:hypothetical protein